MEEGEVRARPAGGSHAPRRRGSLEGLFGRLALVMSEESSYLRRSRGDCSALRRGSSSSSRPLGNSVWRSELSSRHKEGSH